MKRFSQRHLSLQKKWQIDILNYLEGNISGRFYIEENLFLMMKQNPVGKNITANISAASIQNNLNQILGTSNQVHLIHQMAQL